MTSPVGHFLGAAIVARGLSRSRTGASPIWERGAVGSGWRLWALVLIVANLPDLDFLPGIFVGEFNRYHHQATHSLFAMGLFAGLVYVLARGYGRLRQALSPGRWALLAGAIYASHLLLDCLTLDQSPPLGLQLLWPFSVEYFLSPWPVFMNVEHSGDKLVPVLGAIFSWHNLIAAAVEVLILLPIYLFLGWRNTHAKTSKYRGG